MSVQSSQMSGYSMESAQPDPVWENKQFLLKLIMEQLKITNEDLRDTSIVRTKVRESKIETLLLG